MDPLSLTANIAAVVGLIDTICRVGKETYQLIAAVRNVPAEIQRLQVELHEVEFLLRNVHRYCSEYQTRMSRENLNDSTPITHIYSTLKVLQKEYNEISAIVAKNLDVNAGRTRQKLKTIGGRVKLVLGGKLERSFRNLERCKSQLSIDLQVLGSFNDLAVHDRLESIHDAVSELRDDRMVSVILDEKTTTYTEKSHAVLNSLHSLEAIDSLMAQLSAMRCNIEQENTSNGDVLDDWDDSEHVQRATLPLMLLQSKIKEALQLMMMSKPGHKGLSTLDVQWVRTELESLLAKSHERAAVTIRSSSTTTMAGDDIHKNRQVAVTSMYGQKNRLQQPNKIVSSQFVLQDSPAGKVSIRVQWAKAENPPFARVSDIIVLLAPNPKIAQEGLLVSLSKLHDGLTKPMINRHISSFTVVETTSPIFACIEANDINTLRQLLKNKEFSPNVRNTENESLLSAAAHLLRFEICDLLLNEGADPNHCRSDGANAIYDVRNAFWYRPTHYTIDKSILSRILRLFITAGCDINAVALGGSPLHFTVSTTLPGSKLIDEAEIAALINLLICTGCDIEHENVDGLTPLLYNACIPQWHGVIVLRELLQWGANAHATTYLGEGALHLAIAFSGPGSALGQIDGNALEARLRLLLRAGCDPNLLDNGGHSPSDFAMSSPRIWFQWCLAVERAGLSMEEILGQEGVRAPVQAAYQSTPVEDAEWESCGSEDEDEGYQNETRQDTCFDADHVFLFWKGFFPWSVSPRCGDCGLLCDLDDIERRKWDAWIVFQSLREHFLTHPPQIPINGAPPSS
ncbi:ankyrin repeat domain-containing protein [Aspergillus clavatus NRRL 1]|uniref:Ankyrin repeat protein n=1 Tax=Aspergillus clavatus (strain ATCC 1007 / CBS 513.65 / DSM 816 / NCTC 3887 / NRRL 1 / QM 1276 / 107) TaxID=344612 RepID=A1CEF8_ASPCL|nr:ankyrin repeat protein [Aspergillus clavatus NRRL 1]EAW11257.1 ankyrin repeat protein [Aspergillus clavatus NRRL 1]